MKKISISLVLLFTLFINIFANNLQDYNQKDYEAYIKLLDNKCNKKDFKSCHDLAFAFYNGIGVEKKLNLAFSIFNRTCKNNFLQSCFNVGVMSENGQGIKKDEFLAFDMYNLTCVKNKKNGYKIDIGCSNLALLYIDGRGVRQDYKKGMELLNDTCKNGVLKNCEILTKIYKDGYLGIKPKPKEHIELLEFLCKKNNANSCYDLAGELFSKDDTNLKNSAISYLKKSCDLKLAKSCLDLGVLYTNGIFVKQNFELSKEFFGKACDLRDDTGCKSYRILNSKNQF